MNNSTLSQSHSMSYDHGSISLLVIHYHPVFSPTLPFRSIVTINKKSAWVINALVSVILLVQAFHLAIDQIVILVTHRSNYSVIDHF